MTYRKQLGVVAFRYGVLFVVILGVCLGVNLLFAPHRLHWQDALWRALFLTVLNAWLRAVLNWMTRWMAGE